MFKPSGRWQTDSLNLAETRLTSKPSGRWQTGAIRTSSLHRSSKPSGRWQTWKKGCRHIK